MKIGTSEHGSVRSASQLQLPQHKHALIVVGGPLGLEDCYTKDAQRARNDVTELFDMWINTCPNQGSRTIRTEEAILITMSFLQHALC
jgi:predicted SPOUT superfamily RNA methylase MTH1